MGNKKAYKSAQKNKHGAEAQEKDEICKSLPWNQYVPKFEGKEIQMDHQINRHLMLVNINE